MLDPSLPLLQGTVFNYRYIDHGAQFKVYAVLNADGQETGRVIKIPLDFSESKRVLAPHLKKLNLAETEIDQRIHRILLSKQQLPRLFQGIYARDKRLMQTLGNLKLIPVLAQPQTQTPEYFMPLYFTQNQAIPMSRFMHQFRFAQTPPYHITLSDTRSVTKLMRSIIDLHYYLWEYGIFETTFKLENIGVLQTGHRLEVILVDGAEHTFDLMEAEGVIERNRWHHAMATNKTDHLFLPTILHQQYTELCSKSFTKEALRKHWRKRSNAIERRAAQKLRLKQHITHNSQKELMLWIQQQTLHNSLYSGIPRERIDNSLIPQSDLRMLLADNRIDILEPTELKLQENAERNMAQSHHAVWTEVYRHTFPATQ